MNELACGSEIDAGVAEPAARVVALRSAGYCAGCGTWDSHGMSCAACGYDFTSEDGGLSRDSAD